MNSKLELIKENGFIKLDDYFSKYSKSKINNVGKLFWFNFFEKNVLYKTCSSRKKCYIELINEEFIKLIGLKSAHYDLAKFNGRYGVISYDFREENHKYISMDIILKKYYVDVILKDSNASLKVYDEMNNLEDIWYSLEYYFKDYKNKNEIVKNLMNDIVKLFLYDLFVNQKDRHTDNYIIDINCLNNNVSLAPIFDYENSFHFYNDFNCYIRVNDNIYNSHIPDTINIFLKESSYEFQKLLYSNFELLNYNNFINAIESVEKRCNIKIPNKIRFEIIIFFVTNNYIINRILDDFNNGSKRMC